MDYKDLTPEQMEKARACTNVEELLALAEAEGIELSDEELDAVSGGVDWGGIFFCSDDQCQANYG